MEHYNQGCGSGSELIWLDFQTGVCTFVGMIFWPNYQLCVTLNSDQDQV
jgi:hypothetical protein